MKHKNDVPDTILALQCGREVVMRRDVVVVDDLLRRDRNEPNLHKGTFQTTRCFETTLDSFTAIAFTMRSNFSGGTNIY